MRAALDSEKWDLVLSDYSMPNFSGKKAMKILRERNIEAPFIFVSGTIGEDTAIAGLKSGRFLLSFGNCVMSRSTNAWRWR